MTKVKKIYFSKNLTFLLSSGYCLVTGGARGLFINNIMRFEEMKTLIKVFDEERYKPLGLLKVSEPSQYIIYIDKGCCGGLLNVN